MAGRDSRVLYEIVTNDAYELPVFVADTVQELSDRSGIPRTTLESDLQCRAVCRTRYKVIRVVLDDD